MEGTAYRRSVGSPVSFSVFDSIIYIHRPDVSYRRFDPPSGLTVTCDQASFFFWRDVGMEGIIAG